MSAIQMQYYLSQAAIRGIFKIPDPGNGKAIPNDLSGTVPIVTTGAETRTVADPQGPNLFLTLVMVTDGGDCVVTFASAIDVAGGVTTRTFADVRDTLVLRSVPTATGNRWQIVFQDFVASVEPSDALQGVTKGTVTASKAVVVDANKDIASFRDVTVRNIKIADSAGDNVITISGAGDEAADRTLSVPLMGGNKTVALLGTSVGTQAFTDRLTTTDNVTSGDARRIGGMAFVDVAAADTVTAATSNNSFVSFAQTYAVPANTVKQGTVIKIRAMVDISDAAAGTDTLTCNIRFGGTSLLATTAVDQAANDFQMLEFTLVGRAAPGGTAAVVGSGFWTTSTGGTNVHKGAIMQSTNFATNGALTIDVQAKWSSNSATTTARLQLLTVEII